MTEIDNTSMNFFDHLKELRQKLLYVIIFFLLTFVISFYFSQSIFEFLAKPLTSILGEGNGLIYTALQEAFLTNVKVAFFTAAFISFPFLSIQIWSFVSPGLLKKEILETKETVVKEGKELDEFIEKNNEDIMKDKND